VRFAVWRAIASGRVIRWFAEKQASPIPGGADIQIPIRTSAPGGSLSHWRAKSAPERCCEVCASFRLP